LTHNQNKVTAAQEDIEKYKEDIKKAEAAMVESDQKLKAIAEE
jgi:hypothetical protein